MAGRTQIGCRRAATVAAVVLSLAASVAAPRAAVAYEAQACRNVHGRLVCAGIAPSGGTAGYHAYDRWQDGTMALGSSAPPETYRFPHYLGGHSAWYGFGR